MNYIRLFFILLALFSSISSFSQIGHGGTPYFLQPNILRASSQSFFVEMPAFNLDSVLRKNALNEENMRGSYSFAYKFYPHIDIHKDASLTILQDGTKVRQIGIRSEGAYSINLLLRDFEIPPGGKLFVYSADYSQVVGSFDYRNSSPEKILQIQPVAGESVVVEYSEPADVPFEGSFTIAEVNHDYRDFFRREPAADVAGNDFACMPDVFCGGADEQMVRATVLLMIDGTDMCTGTLINNTKDDGKPYLLTAVHCLNSQIQYVSKDMVFYDNKAGTIVAFFNYNRPVCDANIKMKGTEEMSLSGANARVIIEKKDIALLEFLDPPPNYFNAYYAGWNVDPTGGSAPHMNFHHPYGAVKKYGIAEAEVTLVSSLSQWNFDSNSHWKVPYWTIGSTYGGSSGSPLVDKNQLVIGGLTGGSSTCRGNSPDNQSDYFFAMFKGWETDNPANQLKTFLDPANKGLTQYPGLDPNQDNPMIRLTNARYMDNDLLVTSKLGSTNQGFVFGNSNLQTLEFAEEFAIDGETEIFGAYLLMPAMPWTSVSGVTVSVYTGNSSPETKLYSTQFIPQYRNYSSSSGFYYANKNLNRVPTESFVHFNNPVLVNKRFFISYTITYSTTEQFCVYNTIFGDSSHPNTAWIKDETRGWVPANRYSFQAMSTSLAVQPVIRNRKSDAINNTLSGSEKNQFYYDRSERILTLKDPLSQPGRIEIYSIVGQLLERIPVQPGQKTFVLTEKSGGTVGIVKIISPYSSLAGKIRY